MQATIKDIATLPIAMPDGQASGLFVDRSGKLHSTDEPFGGGKQITPSDSTDIVATHRALYVGTGGTLAAVILDADGSTRNTIATTVSDGSVFPFRVLRVLATGTTALGLIAGH
jgi:hypothetical protein